MFNNLTLQRKFTLTGVVLALLLLFDVVAVVTVADRVEQTSRRFADVELKRLDRTHQLKLSVLQVQQWLTDISATRAQDGLNDGFDEAAKYAAKFRQLQSELLTLDPENRNDYMALLPAFNAYYDTGRRMAQAYIDSGPTAGNRVMAEFDKVAATLTEQVDRLVSEEGHRAIDLINEQSQHLHTTGVSLLISLLLLMLAIAGAGWMMSGAIRRLPKVAAELERIAGGDISGPPVASGQTHDEVNTLCVAMNQMKHSLRGLLQEINQTITEMASAVAQLSAFSSQTSSAIGRQQQEVNQVATAMHELSATAHEVANHAEAAASAAHEADNEARAGRNVVNEVVTAIETSASNVRRAAETLATLDQSTANIGSILSVIREIADQTNLLALNAAIEAARAGEQGRGFAVVADEVRTLAQRSQRSTEEIQQMIEQLQAGANNTVKAMDEGRAQTEASVSYTTRAGERLAAITRAVSTINEMNSHIATAAGEQSRVAEAMNSSIASISSVSEQTAGGAREIASAGERLRAMATALQQQVGRFRF